MRKSRVDLRDNARCWLVLTAKQYDKSHCHEPTIKFKMDRTLVLSIRINVWTDFVAFLGKSHEKP